MNKAYPVIILLLIPNETLLTPCTCVNSYYYNWYYHYTILHQHLDRGERERKIQEKSPTASTLNPLNTGGGSPLIHYSPNLVLIIILPYFFSFSFCLLSLSSSSSNRHRQILPNRVIRWWWLKNNNKRSYYKKPVCNTLPNLKGKHMLSFIRCRSHPLTPEREIERKGEERGEEK